MLDERLKSNEHATAALLGTLLHQVFQVHCSMKSLMKLCWTISILFYMFYFLHL